MVKLLCTQCGHEFERRAASHSYEVKIRKAKTHFCTPECMKKYRIKSVVVPCATCGTDVTATRSRLRRSVSGKIFCSKSCSVVDKNKNRTGLLHPNYNNGKASYRSNAFKFYGESCTVCGYNNKIVLEVHHKDGNRNNNDISNLDVLCPTHHKEYQTNIR